jgi:hypothetical protein
MKSISISNDMPLPAGFLDNLKTGNSPSGNRRRLPLSPSKKSRAHMASRSSNQQQIMSLPQTPKSPDHRLKYSGEDKKQHLSILSNDFGCTAATNIRKVI